MPRKADAPVESPRRINLDAPRELVRLADNGLLAIGAKTTLTFDADGRQRAALSKIAYFPESLLVPDPRRPRAFTVFDRNLGSFALYRWDEKRAHSKDQDDSFLLPTATLDFSELSSASCTLLQDGSFACLKGAMLYSSWPGYPPKKLGEIASGATVSTLVPGARADRVDVLRSDARLEEYWITNPPKLLSSQTLLWAPFQLLRVKTALVLLRFLGGRTNVEFHLQVLEDNEGSRWSVELDRVDYPSSPEQFDRELMACREIAAHPTKPWVAVSDCSSITVFDRQTGDRILKLEDVPF
ncbi:MAG: hypothetical protein QM784_24755 [Polyangiaceae bacterium]